MKLNNTLKKAIAFAFAPFLFVACNTTSEDPIPQPEPEPDPIVKTPVAIPDTEFEKLGKPVFMLTQFDDDQIKEFGDNLTKILRKS